MKAQPGGPPSFCTTYIRDQSVTRQLHGSESSGLCSAQVIPANPALRTRRDSIPRERNAPREPTSMHGLRASTPASRTVSCKQHLKVDSAAVRR